MLMGTSNIIPFVSFQMTTHTAPVLFTRFKHCGGILEAEAPERHKIYYIPDGCGGQYKNFKNFLKLCSHKEGFSIKAE